MYELKGKGEVELDCKSTLEGWAPDEVGRQPKVRSGTWVEVGLTKLECELPDDWQIRSKASHARAQTDPTSGDIGPDIV